MHSLAQAAPQGGARKEDRGSVLAPSPERCAFDSFAARASSFSRPSVADPSVPRSMRSKAKTNYLLHSSTL